MATEIISQLENALADTVALLSSFNEKDLNAVPFEGSWTAAQVGRHLFKSENGIDQLLYAPAQPAGRQPDERAEGLRAILMDFGTKLKCPDFLLPEDTHYDKEALLESLQGAKEKLLDAARKADLSFIAPLPESHPLNGNTKLEMVHFMAYHTVRHNNQIKSIMQVLQ